MQNQAAVEALYSATFVEDYLDYVENVPDDIQRIHTRLRELDMKQHQDILSELDNLVKQFEETKDAVGQKRLLNKMMMPLIASQDIGDDKIQLVQNMSDIIENRTRQLELDSQNLDFGRGEEEEEKVKVKEEKPDKHVKRKKVKDEEKSDENTNVKSSTPGGKKLKKSTTTNNASATSGGSAAGGGGTSATGTAAASGGSGGSSAGGGGGNGSGGTSTGTTGSTNKKRGNGRNNKEERVRSTSPPELANVEIDPDEPTYCLCDQVSYGEMIGCDNDLCPIEWFHFNCVQLNGKPKGKWFCPKCRGDKPTVMKPKAQFLKELERFNKEKEEKLK